VGAVLGQLQETEGEPFQNLAMEVAGESSSFPVSLSLLYVFPSHVFMVEKKCRGDFVATARVHIANFPYLVLAYQKLIKELPSLVPVEAGDGSARDAAALPQGQSLANTNSTSDLDSIGNNPGEVAFFRLLHGEFNKVCHFFDRAQEEFVIREERVRQGMEITKQPNSPFREEKWSLLAKSIYRLYKDLLLLETFSIMNLLAFSKILKKHDKTSGFNTKKAFMDNVVGKANFANYPKVLDMISGCQQLYDIVSERLLRDGKQALHEDERLFINMVQRLNRQVMEGVAEECALAKIDESSRPVALNAPSALASGETESWATSSLRRLVNENDARRRAYQASEVTLTVSEPEEGTDGVPPSKSTESRRRGLSDLSGTQEGDQKRHKV
jgi:SPX domain